MRLFSRLQQYARTIKVDTLALYLAARHPATPWYARLVVVIVVAYAFSPIDLIPDFIPVLGYLDDLILIPLGIALSIRLIPPSVMATCRAQARERLHNARPVSRVAAAIIVLIWIAAAVLAYLWARETFFLARKN